MKKCHTLPAFTTFSIFKQNKYPLGRFFRLSGLAGLAGLCYMSFLIIASLKK